MNQLTPIISKYLTEKYRGYDCFQQETILNDIYSIFNILSYVNDKGGSVDVSTDSESFKDFYTTLDMTSNELRKNVFPTLERLGLIYRQGSSWDTLHLTHAAQPILNTTNEEDLEESIRTAFRSLLKDPEFGTVIKRIKSLISDSGWGKMCWWEVWFCLRLDIDFETIKADVKAIRSLYKLKTINKITLEKIRNDFDEHSVKQGDLNPFLNVIAVKGNGTLDFNNLRNKISNGIGVKLVHYGLRVDDASHLMTVDLSLSRNNKRVLRNYKRTNDLLLENFQVSEFDYHHIVPFDNSHFHPDLHKEIDDIKNLIPIRYDDHKKFPNKQNHYLILTLTSEQKLRFHSVHNQDEFIELDDISHLDLNKLKEVYIPYNRNLYKKLV